MVRRVLGMAAMASLSPLSATSLPRPPACCFKNHTHSTWACFAASNGCGVLRAGRCTGLRLQWRSPVHAKIDEVDKDTGADLGFRRPDRKRLRLRLRLRPRLRLMWWRFRRLSSRDLAGDAAAALRRAVRSLPPAAAAPVILALLLLAARLTLPKNAAREVPYSDLVAGLRAGAVATVAFEEDSRRIYFSKAGDGADDDDARKAGRGAPAAKWPYYARRVPHDEGFLLGLMRDGGVDYRSAPRPAGRLLVDMLSTLLTLWVSLLPMMWFIQRQMSAGGGGEKRRRSRKQRVGFDDVQGVDEAKEELVEVNSGFLLLAHD